MFTLSPKWIEAWWQTQGLMPVLIRSKRVRFSRIISGKELDQIKRLGLFDPPTHRNIRITTKSEFKRGNIFRWEQSQHIVLEFAVQKLNLIKQEVRFGMPKTFFWNFFLCFNAFLETKLHNNYLNFSWRE